MKIFIILYDVKNNFNRWQYYLKFNINFPFYKNCNLNGAENSELARSFKVLLK